MFWMKLIVKSCSWSAAVLSIYNGAKAILSKSAFLLIGSLMVIIAAAVLDEVSKIVDDE